MGNCCSDSSNTTLDTSEDCTMPERLNEIDRTLHTKKVFKVGNCGKCMGSKIIQQDQIPISVQLHGFCSACRIRYVYKYAAKPNKILYLYLHP